MTDHDRAQLAARCGSPRCPLTTEEQLAHVTAERDALRGALVALVTAQTASDAAELAMMVTGKREDIDSAERLLDEATDSALDVLARTGGDR